MIKIVALFLFSLNLFAIDSRSSGTDVPSPQQEDGVVVEAGQTGNKVDLFAHKSTFDQILDDKTFVKQFTSLKKALDNQWPEISSDLRSKLGKEFDRYNLGTVFGLQGNQIKILGSSVADIEFNSQKFNVAADLYYRIEVQPSFIQGKQLRKDIYVIGLRGSSHISAGTEIRITFFREFASKSAALLDWKPYGLDQIPRSADDVMSRLKVHDGIRVEAFANLEISDAISKLTNDTSFSAFLGYDLFQGIFLLDIYKYSLNDVRARFMGTINRGTLKGSAGLNWVAKYKVSGILSRLFKDIFDIDLRVNISKSFNFFNEYPIETHISDYFFRFNSGKISESKLSQGCNFRALAEDSDLNSNRRPFTAEAAFDELLGNVRSGKFVSLFNPSLKEEAMSQALLSNASIAESIACQDQGLPSEKKRVLNFFKGRMSSDIFSLDFGPKISRIIRSNVSAGNSEIFVASVEQNQDINHYLLLNSYQKFFSTYVFGRWENEYISDIDALYLSDKNKNVVQFLDFVKRIQYKDKILSPANLKEVYQDVDRSIPRNFPGRDRLLGLIPNTEQRDGLVSLVYTLSNKIVYEIEKMEKAELYNRLESFIENHPDKHLMNLTSDHSDGQNVGTFNQVVTNIFYDLVRFANTKQESKERYEALRNLMRNRLFTEYIFTDFFPTLMSSNLAADAMSVQMSVSSGNMALSELRIGNNQYSSVYSAVLLLRSLLNDRSLNLGLQSVTAEENISRVNPITINGFNIAN